MQSLYGHPEFGNIDLFNSDFGMRSLLRNPFIRYRLSPEHPIGVDGLSATQWYICEIGAYIFPYNFAGFGNLEYPAIHPLVNQCIPVRQTSGA